MAATEQYGVTFDGVDAEVWLGPNGRYQMGTGQGQTSEIEDQEALALIAGAHDTYQDEILDLGRCGEPWPVTQHASGDEPHRP